jgi:hypothetical protein
MCVLLFSATENAYIVALCLQEGKVTCFVRQRKTEVLADDAVPRRANERLKKQSQNFQTNILQRKRLMNHMI